MDYFSFHIGDFAKSTGHLTLMEDGIYNRLMRRYYDTEKPLSADVTYLQRIVMARTEDERQAVLSVLAEFFTLEEDGYHNKRCDEVIAAYQKLRDDNTTKANKRWGNKPLPNKVAQQEDSTSNADGMPLHCRGNTNHKPITINQKPETNNQDRHSLAGVYAHPREAVGQECELFAGEKAAAAEASQPLPKQPLPQQAATPNFGEQQLQAVSAPQAQTKPKTRRPKSAKTPLPEGFGISDGVRKWAEAKGHKNLEAHLEAFVDKALAKGYTNLDWDSAFKTAVREDWAGLNKPKINTGTGGYSYGRNNRSSLPWTPAEIQKPLDDMFAKLATVDPDDQMAQQRIILGYV